MGVVMGPLSGFWVQLTTIYYSIDQLWLGIGVAVSVMIGAIITRLAEQLGAVWGIIVFLLVSAGLFTIFLLLTQVSPVFFSPFDLARRQVSI